MLQAAINNAGDPHFGQLLIPSIDLEEAGLYQLRFVAYMFCNVTACDPAGDRIRIIINDNSDNADIREDPKIMTINYENIGQQRVWNNMFFDFNTRSSNIQVNLII
jgi:hypothetical protein